MIKNVGRCQYVEKDVSKVETFIEHWSDESWTGWSRDGQVHVTKTKDPLYIKKNYNFFLFSYLEFTKTFLEWSIVEKSTKFKPPKIDSHVKEYSKPSSLFRKYLKLFT